MHTLSLVRIKKKQWIGVCDGWHDDVDLKVMGCLGRGSKATRCQKTSCSHQNIHKQMELSKYTNLEKENYHKKGRKWKN